MEQDDGYKVNLQMEFPADNVERWLQVRARAATVHTPHRGFRTWCLKGLSESFAKIVQKQTVLQGFYEMDFGSIKSVTKLHIDPSDVDNTTREYYHQRNCAFGFDQLNVNLL